MGSNLSRLTAGVTAGLGISKQQTASSWHHDRLTLAFADEHMAADQYKKLQVGELYSHLLLQGPVGGCGALTVMDQGP
jgi:hypothetical protein